MGNTLITFRDQYYEYGGSVDPKKRGLTIGGYESAWLEDLVAAYLQEKTNDLFSETTQYHGIYRGYGLVVFKGKWPERDIQRWVEVFQLRINDVTDSEDIVFTAEIWNPIKTGNATTTELSKTVSTVEKISFPYLDLELF